MRESTQESHYDPIPVPDTRVGGALLDVLLLVVIALSVIAALYIALNPTPARAGTPVSSAIGATRSILEDQLLEPSRTRFRAVTVRTYPDGMPLVCGELNGPNHFGGMTGWQPFTVDVEQHSVLFGSDSPARTAVGRICGPGQSAATDGRDYSDLLKFR